MLRILTKREYESLPKGSIKCIGLSYDCNAPISVLVNDKIVILIKDKVLPDNILHPHKALSHLLYGYFDLEKTPVPERLGFVYGEPSCLPHWVANSEFYGESLENYLFNSVPENKLKGISMLLDFDFDRCFLITSKYEEYSHICPVTEEVKSPLKWSEILEIVGENEQIFVDTISKRLQDLSICNITGSSKNFGDYGLDISVSLFVYFTIDI